MVNSKEATRKLKKQYYKKNRDSISKRKKQRYSTDLAYREVIKQNSKMCYHNDEDYRHAKIETAKQKIKERYHNDEDYRKIYKKKVATRIMGRYWGDKSYNEKIKFSARLYRRTHKNKWKNYIQKYKKMAKMQADLRKLSKILRMFYHPGCSGS